MTSFHSYSPRTGHGLAHDPFKALVSPRPIGWISTLSQTGVRNLAPYSFFNAIADTPPMVMFSSSSWKDSARNAIATGSFVHNLVSRQLADKMVASSAPLQPDESEFDHAGLAFLESELVAAPRVAEAYATLECVVTQHQQLMDSNGAETSTFIVIGEVVRVHINEQVISDGMVDEAALQMVSRLGYRSYGLTDNIFELVRPTEK